MKIGVFTVLFGDKPFEETLDYVKELGLEAVEIGTGAYPGDAHCKPARAVEERQEAEGVQAGHRSTRSGDQRAQLPRQPDPSRQEAREVARRDLQADRRARAKLGVKQVITFSGCPGGDPKATQPNWITSSWPPEFPQMLEWQWKERVLPYWKEAAKLLKQKGCASPSRCTRTSSPTTRRRCCGCRTSRRARSAATSIPATCSGSRWTCRRRSARWAIASTTCTRRTAKSTRPIPR